MYIVREYFTDLQDNDYPYQAGDVYPREGLEPSPERFKELAGENNLRGTALIVAVKDEGKAEEKAAKKPRKLSKKAAEL